MRTTYIHWGEREVEIGYTPDGGDPSVGMNPGAEDMHVISVDGGKSPAVIVKAEAWFESDTAAQQKVHEAACEALDDDFDF